MVRQIQRHGRARTPGLLTACACSHFPEKINHLIASSLWPTAKANLPRKTIFQKFEFEIPRQNLALGKIRLFFSKFYSWFEWNERMFSFEENEEFPLARSTFRKVEDLKYPTWPHVQTHIRDFRVKNRGGRRHVHRKCKFSRWRFF